MPEQEVKITALRPSDLPTLDPSSTKVRSASLLQSQTGNFAVSDALRTMSSSLEVRRYGTLGSIGQLTFRGLPVEYTVFYRDGVRITNEQLGLTDLGQLTLHGLSTIELIPASSAVLLGGDAIGAAINLVSSYSDSVEVRLGTEQTGYSHGSGFPQQSYYGSAASHPTQALSIVAGYSHDGSTGNYPYFDSSSNGYRIRSNNDASLTSANIAARYQLDDVTSLRLNGQYFHADRSVPGAIGVLTRGVRQRDDQGIGGVRIDHEDSLNGYSGSIGYQNQFEEYFDPSHAVADSSWNAIYNFDARYHRDLLPWLAGFVGAEVLHTRLTGTTNASEVNDLGDSILVRNRIAGYAAFQALPFERLSLTASLRAESVTGMPIQLLPQTTASLWLTPKLQASFAWSRSFHAPTLNDLYWKGLGNPDLKPEHGSNWQATLSYNTRVLEQPLHLAAIYFNASIDNEIVWTPSRDNLDHPINVGSVSAKGVELHAEWSTQISNRIGLRFEENYTILSAHDHTVGSLNFGKELQYTSPTSSMFIGGISAEGIGHISLLARYDGHRFSDPANTAQGLLPPVTTFDLTLTSSEIRVGSLGALAALSVQNLTDRNYFEAINYPLPGRTFQFSIELHYH